LGTASTAGAALHGNSQADPFKFAPKSQYEMANNGKALSLSNLNAKKSTSRSIVSDADLQHTLPSSYYTGYLDGPDGTTWFYTQDIEYTEIPLEGDWATKKIISKYSYTIYNSNYEVVGSFSDDINLADDETGVSAIELGACVTQKFFNTDSNYEVMVMIAANTAQYVNHVYTKVYSIGVDGAIDTIEGYYINAVNAGTYSEKYYITFFQDPYLPKSEVYGTEEAADESGEEQEDEETVYTYHYDIYAPASYSSPTASVLKTLITPYDQLEGYDATPFIGVAYNGAAYFAVMKYAKPYFANSTITYDPQTGLSRDLTPNTDNSFVIDLYKSGYNSLSLSSTTTIPMELKDATGTTCSFYQVGLMNYDNDVSFGVWSNDSKPTFIVTVEDYVSNTDTSIYHFYAYDVDGNKVATISEDVQGLIDVSDLPGYESQQGFYKTVDDVDVFQFVDIPSCKLVATLPVTLENGNSLTSSCDRVATKDSYQYAFSLAYGVTDNDDNTSHYIAWYNADGSFDHNDIIPLGKQVALALPYVKKSALNPYLFNTDSNREYMFLVKNYISTSGTATQESFIVLNTDGDVLCKLSDNDTLGSLRSINLLNASDDPSLWLIYYNDDTDLYTSSFLSLPFTKFEMGGDGSAENPFLISTIGDLQLMQGNLTANYKLAADIDASGFDFQPVGEEFKGSLDGDNYTISNLSLENDSYYNGLFQTLSSQAVVKNINFKDAYVVVGSENSSTALIAPMVYGDNAGAPEISNIHVDGYVAVGDEPSYANFGGLVGKITLGTAVKDCSIANAEFDFAECRDDVNTIGGIATQIMTGSNIDRCSFQGYISGGSNIGGILSKLSVTGVSTTGQEHIANCHVNANIDGYNNIGGIVATTGRAPIYNNYVEGTLKATTNEKWGGGAKTGGIIGDLAEDWTDTPSKIVYGNVVALSSISVPEIGSQSYDNEATTSHRIVGYTIYNSEPLGSTPSDPDAGIQDNYVVGDLAVVDSGIEAGANTTEGANLEADSFNEEFLATLGFAFGEDATAPWVLNDSNLHLYFEKETSGVANMTVAPAVLSKTANAFVANGCKIAVYNFQGMNVANANDTVSTTSLAPGVYVVTAAKNGIVIATAKFVVK
jgi:hypothetical protein